jgi:exodeoxyribonuclease VII large subunit
VRVRGRLSVYDPRGEYELNVEALDPVGAGALRVAFEQLRERLAAEGLFDAEIKRELPLFPRRVGLVTSPAGAALRDILSIIARRTRTVHVMLAPTRVQGEGASLEIARAIELLNQYHAQALASGRMEETIDVIIVGRGGGSIEDLWAFNEEVVAHALRASSIPVISAVGHETDITISDLAADMRAPTPSAAAELVAAREDELEAYTQSLARDLLRAARSCVLGARLRVQDAAMSPAFDETRSRLRDSLAIVETAAHRLETSIMRARERARRRTESISCRLAPAKLGARVSAARVRFNVLCAERDAAGAARLETARSRFIVATAALDALSPLAVLKRGYALVQDEQGKLLRDARGASVGDSLKLRLAKGVLSCRVEKVEEY